MSVETRLWSKVDRNGECWRWLGSATPHGYGRLNVNGVPVPAHRVAFEVTRGPIADGLELDHLCRHAWCVNPAHLDPVTHAENVRRGEAGKYQSRRTHCARGHAYDGTNTIVTRTASGMRRNCRECARIRGRLWARQKRARESIR